MKPLVYRDVTLDKGKSPQWLSDLKNANGAYVIRRKSDGKPLYVGESHSSRLAGTITRHFAKWYEPERPHFTYSRGSVEVAVRLCPPPAAVSCQNRLIRRLQPRDNTNGYAE